MFRGAMIYVSIPSRARERVVASIMTPLWGCVLVSRACASLILDTSRVHLRSYC